VDANAPGKKGVGFDFLFGFVDFAAELMPRNAGAGLREALQRRQSNFIDREAARR